MRDEAALLEREVRLREPVDPIARVFHEVVPEEAEEDEVGREFPAPAPESQELLVGPVARHAEIHDLEARAEVRREAAGQDRVLRHAASEHERVAEHEHPVSARRLRVGVGRVSEARGVRREAVLPPRGALRPRDVGLERPTQFGVAPRERAPRVRGTVGLEERLRKERPQPRLGHRQGHGEREQDEEDVRDDTPAEAQTRETPRRLSGGGPSATSAAD